MQNSNVCYLPEPSYSKEDFCDVMKLMANSPYHENFTLTNLMRTVVPPLQLGQYNIFKAQGDPIGYVSWAWLTPTAGLGYATRQRLLQPSDWSAGNQLWVISVIGQGLNPRSIVNFLKQRFETPQQKEQFRKEGKPFKVHWHRAKNKHKLGVKQGRV
jgi:cytolysin-activating lysine-acyltransferase